MRGRAARRSRADPSPPNPSPARGEGNSSPEHPMQEPLRALSLSAVQPLPVEPVAAPRDVLGAEIVAGGRVEAPPPGRGDAFGALDRGDFVQHAAPAEA